MDGTQQLLSTAQVAELLGVSPRTVQRMADDGRLAYAEKFPATAGYVFRRADVEQLAAELAGERAS